MLVMPIKARCPYCRVYRLRAPDHAVGQSVTCKNCHNCFTIVETEQEAPLPSGAHPSLIARHAEPLAQSHSEPASSIAVTADAPSEPEFDDAPEPQAVEMLPPATAPQVFERRNIRPRPDSAFVVALFSIMAGGVGLSLSQTGLAHYGTVAGGTLGLVLAVIGLARVDKRLSAPMFALAFNLVAVAVVVLLPEWLNLRSWRPPVESDTSTVVLAVGHNGTSAPAGEWIDASTSSWQLGHTRVTAGRVSVGPVEIAGPDGKKRLTHENYVQLRVRIKNVGVFGAVRFSDWSSDSIRLVDSAGNLVARKTFDSGIEPTGRCAPAKLAPSQAIDCLLFFEAVPTNISYLRLDLPGEAFGVAVHVRMEIPWRQILFRPAPSVPERS
jgi:hypothetical protein